MPTSRQGIKIDWDPIRTAFVEGVPGDDGLKWINLKEAAERFDVNYSMLRRVAGSEGWTEERSSFQRMIEVQRREARATELASIALEFDGDSITTARAGMRGIGRRIGELLVAATPVAQRSDKQRLDFPDVAYRSIPAKEISALASAALKFQTLGRRGLGLSEGSSRLELTGADGGPMERVNVHEVLVKPDPDRLSGFLVAAIRSGLLDDFDPEATEVIDVDSPELGAGDSGPLPEDDTGAAE